MTLRVTGQLEMDLLHEKPKVYDKVGNINAHGDWFNDLPHKIDKWLDSLKEQSNG